MEGYLLIDKPLSWTSFDVVKRVRFLVARSTNTSVRKIKVGHSGTLDPFASGLLILLIGKDYTTRASELLRGSKTYNTVMELDSFSSTGDSYGEITKLKNPKSPPTKSELMEGLNSFKGEISQTPPAYSAIKVNGVRAYKLARENLPVELKPRQVSIKSLQLIAYDYPEVNFQTEVSGGTYIRSLVEDIGRKLDRCAYTKELRRTAIGRCSIDQAITINQINEQNIRTYLRKEIVC